MRLASSAPTGAACTSTTTGFPDRSPQACVEAGLDIAFGEAARTHTPTERARFFERACDDGVALGCVRLAFHYGTGLGVTRDYQRAYELMDRGCRCHEDMGCSGVAWLLREGHGRPHD